MYQEKTVVKITQAFAYALAHEFGPINIVQNDGNTALMDHNKLLNGKDPLSIQAELKDAFWLIDCYGSAKSDPCNADRSYTVGISEIVEEAIGTYIEKDQIKFQITN